MMYKRTKGQDKKMNSTSTVHGEAVDRALELMDEGAAPMSLVASPRTRVKELKAIFKAEYPQLDFNTYERSCESEQTEATGSL